MRKDQHTSKRMRAWNQKTQAGTDSNCTRTQSCAVGHGPRGGPSRSLRVEEFQKNGRLCHWPLDHGHCMMIVCARICVCSGTGGVCSTHPSAYRPSIIPAGSCVKLHDGTAVVDAADAARDAASEMSHMAAQRESAAVRGVRWRRRSSFREGTDQCASCRTEQSIETVPDSSARTMVMMLMVAVMAAMASTATCQVCACSRNTHTSQCQARPHAAIAHTLTCVCGHISKVIEVCA